MSRKAEYNQIELDELYNYIVEYCKKSSGRPPAMREIQLALGISSSSIVYFRLKKLEKIGKIEFIEHDHTQVKSYRVVGGAWIAP